ncbi:DUF6932 family protein [Chamaesiphon sp. OTE_8_metabat_110]|uniref:DUF6932 family protein n=1 Tax=Chamaesiphon sp. OTE_8_metabat_110 TaxID=2964696 RepID=UPI00286BEDE8|nr:hypothetical protein [Chamaesiphon sp. OTE_8_metabat_110]
MNTDRSVGARISGAKDLIAAHGAKTGSQKAQEILNRRAEYLPNVTSKEQPNDFDGCFDPMTVDLYSLDPVFDSAAAQQDRFGGDLKPNPNFVGFFQTDRDGNSRGVIEIDPREVLHSP